MLFCSDYIIRSAGELDVALLDIAHLMTPRCVPLSEAPQDFFEAILTLKFWSEGLANGDKTADSMCFVVEQGRQVVSALTLCYKLEAIYLTAYQCMVADHNPISAVLKGLQKVAISVDSPIVVRLCWSDTGTIDDNLFLSLGFSQQASGEGNAGMEKHEPDGGWVWFPAHHGAFFSLGL